jgi:serine/threonine protein phosphatase PrpC
MRNYVTQCIGLFSHEPEVAVSKGIELQEGDILLLCSDGFWEPLDDAQLGSMIDKGQLNNALNALAERAEATSYPHSDNTTAVALRVISLQQPQRSGRQQTKSKKPGKRATLDDAIAEIERAIKTYEKEMKE